MAKFAEKFKNSPAKLEAFLGNISNLLPKESEKYYKILTKFDFLEDKINHPNFGVEALLRDYDLIYDPEIVDSIHLNLTPNPSPYQGEGSNQKEDHEKVPLFKLSIIRIFLNKMFDKLKKVCIKNVSRF